MQTNEQTHLLLNVEIHRPLFTLLNHCSTHNSEPIERLMISVLNQLCVCICKNARLLQIFFEQAKLSGSANAANSAFYLGGEPLANRQYMQHTSSARFFIFSLLIPYIHKEGALGEFQLLSHTNTTNYSMERS
jgi:hypothetical protein